jgi:hypothetical protein
MVNRCVGSGENHTAYFYKRLSTPAPRTARPGTSLITLPARPSAQGGRREAPLTVVCSDKFKHCVELAAGDVLACQQYVSGVTDDMINAERPKRERKQRVMHDAIR